MAEPTRADPGASGRPDVDALMTRVRAGVDEKIARGVLSRADLEEVRRVELQVRELADLGPQRAEDIARLHALWDPLGPHEFTSHRGGVGALIVAAKRLLRRLARPVAAVALARQAEFNASVARLLAGAANGVDSLGAAHDALLLKHDELERRHRELHARCGELLLQVGRLQGRLESLDRAGLPAAAVAPAPARDTPAAPPAAAGPEPTPLSYLAFEEKHRGPGAAVKEKQRVYLRHFLGAPGRVLDAGCGRGEFLEILREGGVPAYGIDLDAEMAARAREKGLEVTTGDLLGHLAGLPDGSLGGVFAAQVIEHMTTADLVSFVRLAHLKLAPGGCFIAETINPACLATFAGAFYLDLTHVRPVHPEALRFLLEGSGYREVVLEFSSPFPPEMKLQVIDMARWLHDVDKDFVRLVNDNFGRLNGLVYGPQDYAAIARR
jgi:O-antigen chain-terminating methyltransferase